MRLTPAYRLLLVKRDADKIATAIENLRLGILKIADRAHSVAIEVVIERYRDYGAEDALREAGRYMGLALGELDKACQGTEAYRQRLRNG